MVQQKIFSQRYFSIPDFAILCLVATVIYGVVAIGNEWRTEFHPVTQIDLSLWSLPYYTLMSGIRGAVAYFISLGFTLVVGYAAAKSKTAERIVIPLLDIFQSIPVLGFLPGLFMGLVALFPRTNTGLELAAIIMIFTGQVWNMTFSYYSSLKSVPNDFNEASTIIGLNWREKLRKVELPFSAVNLAWNSLLSMAGGWFFLIPCEAFTLGDKEYALPGIGAYMNVAIKKQNNLAVVMAVIAMVTLIVFMDFAIWRPIFSWVQRFRLEDVAGVSSVEPLMKVWIRESKIVRWIKWVYRDYRFKHRTKPPLVWVPDPLVEVHRRAPKFYQGFVRWCKNRLSRRFIKILEKICFGLVFSGVCYGAFKLFLVLTQVSPATWIILVRDMFWTFCRVLIALLISTLWAVPAGIWIGTSPKRIQIAQPLIQILASFPAPLLYPIVLSGLFALHVSFDWGSMVLMMMGVQWYVLFNVLAGALRIPKELEYALELVNGSRWDRWTTLYLPSVFPYLVTGWVTAAGGAWNASVVAEYVYYGGKILKTGGLGADLTIATANENFTVFAASLTLMVFVVILLNRLVWARIYQLAQTRFRMDA